MTAREGQARIAGEVSGKIGQAVAAALASASSTFARQLLTQPEQVELFRKGIEMLDWRYDHMLLRGAAAEQPQPLSELMQAIGHFEQVVARDPGHARALCGSGAYLHARRRIRSPPRCQSARFRRKSAGTRFGHRCCPRDPWLRTVPAGLGF